MAAERIVPIDHETGLPPLILPNCSSEPDDVNYHHHWFTSTHPDLLGEHGKVVQIRSEELTLEALAGVAVRMSRGQRLPRDVHTEFHRQYRGFWRLPKSVDEKFVTAVNGCAGVVSRWAIDITIPGKDQRVRMDDDMFEKLAMPSELCAEDNYYAHNKDIRRLLLGDFFVRYALDKELDMVSERVIDEFLHTNNDTRRRELGNFILTEAIDAAIDPVVPVHRELRKKGLLQHGANDVRNIVRGHVRTRRLPSYYSHLTERFAAA